MKTLRKTLKWVFILLLIGAAVGGGYAYFIWTASDEILRQALLTRIHEVAPEWDVSIARARFDYQGRIHVYDLSLKGADGHSPLLDIAQAVLTVDREHLADPQTPMQIVRWNKCHLHLERDADGVWNIQKLSPLKVPRNVIPEFHAERMTMTLVFHESATGPGVTTTFDDIRLQMIPKGARQFLFKAAAKFAAADEITAEGSWYIDEGTWDLTGTVKHLAVDGALSQLAAHVSPTYRAGSARLATVLDRLSAFGAPSPDDSPPAWPATSSQAPRGPAEPIGLSDNAVSLMGLSAVADLKFGVARWSPGAEFEYKLSVHVLDGELKTPPVPYPLRELRGDIDIENEQILVREFSALSGSTRLRLERGRLLEQGAVHPAEFDLEIVSLPLDERVPGLLRGTLRKIHRELHASGEVDMRAHFEFNGLDRWEHDCQISVKNVSVTHALFPYRVEQIEGTVTQRGEQVHMALEGRAGTQKVSLSGHSQNPGPEAASEIVIQTAGIPIDNRLRAACPEKLRTVIDQLQVQGELEGRVLLERRPGLDQQLLMTVDGRLKNGSVHCVAFPFPVTDVNGEFHKSGDEWTFQDFQGRHGPAEVKWRGAFGPDDRGHNELELVFALAGATFDQQLLAALPADARFVWQEFDPKGGLNVSGRLFWSPGPGEGPRLARLDAQLIDAQITLKSFPFTISDVAARLSYDGEQVHIKSFLGRHDGMTIQVKAGTAQYDRDGQWRVTLDTMNVDDLEATAQFRKSLLSNDLWRIVNTLNPRGKQSISGFLEFRGKLGGDYPVTAAWDTITVYSGTTIDAGVVLKDMHGQASFRGTWDGEQAVGTGEIDLMSVKVFDFQLKNIKGPASINGARLVLGSPPQSKHPERDRADPSKRISARFIDGLLSLDAEVKLGDPMRYQVWMNLEEGELKRYAQLYMAKYDKLSGKVNGKLNLKGVGTNPKLLSGSGNLVINRAALYELPVIVRLFDVLRLVPSDNKAFDVARFVFEIGSGVVHFEGIELVGNSMSLVGRGTVNFDGNLNLKFYSRTGRFQWPVPILRETVNELTKGWIGVDVTGTFADAKTTARPMAQMEDTLRRLLKGFDLSEKRR